MLPEPDLAPPALAASLAVLGSLALARGSRLDPDADGLFLSPALAKDPRGVTGIKRGRVLRRCWLHQHGHLLRSEPVCDALTSCVRKEVRSNGRADNGGSAGLGVPGRIATCQLAACWGVPCLAPGCVVQARGTGPWAPATRGGCVTGQLQR